MLEDAINQIDGIINIYPVIKKITITSKNQITVFWNTQELQSKNFTNSIDLLEWCEKNLKSTLDNETPKNMITSFYYSLKKDKSNHNNKTTLIKFLFKI
jgi:hypothetical protein